VPSKSKPPRKDRPEPAPAQPKPAAGAAKWHARTLGEVAQFFGLQLQTVKEWRTGPNPMPGSEGAWPLNEIVRWKLGRMPAAAKSTSGRLEQMDLEERELDLYMKRIKARDAAKELVSRAAAKLAVEEMFHRIRGRLQSVPEEMANGVRAEDRAEHLALAQQKVRLILREIEEWGLDDQFGDGGATKR